MQNNIKKCYYKNDLACFYNGNISLCYLFWENKKIHTQTRDFDKQDNLPVSDCVY